MLSFRFLNNPAFFELFKEGLINTAIITVFCLFFGFVIGLLLAVMRQSKVKAFRAFGAVWVNVLRNIPFLVQLYFYYFGLPYLGINTDPLVTAIIAMSISVSVGNCEAIRAGLMAVKRSYYECAAALGFGKFQTFRYVVIPISLRIAFKPLVSNFVNIVLSSSCAFSISLVELMGAAKIVNGRIGRPFEIYLLLLIGYCCFTFLISFVSKAVDKRIGIKL